MNFKLEHPRFIVGLLCGTTLLLAALLWHDNQVLDDAIAAMRQYKVLLFECVDSKVKEF